MVDDTAQRNPSSFYSRSVDAINRVGEALVEECRNMSREERTEVLKVWKRLSDDLKHLRDLVEAENSLGS